MSQQGINTKKLIKNILKGDISSLSKAITLCESKLESEQKIAQIIIAALVSDTELEADIIQNELSKHLPRYMIPQVIRYFSEFPINSNGKLDRRLIADLISCS